MKHTKTILSALLPLALVFALAVPAGASGANPPVITKNLPETVYRRTGESAVLKVGASLPEGAAGELRYQWYKWDQPYLDLIDWDLVDWDDPDFDFADFFAQDYFNFEYVAIPGAASNTLTVSQADESEGYMKLSVTVSCDTGEVSAETIVIYMPGFFDSMWNMYWMIPIMFRIQRENNGFFGAVRWTLGYLTRNNYFSASLLILRSKLNLL